METCEGQVEDYGGEGRGGRTKDSESNQGACGLEE